MNHYVNATKITLEEKRKRWDAVKGQVDNITDKLGKPIDEEIKELIVGLNIFGFRTSMSCFGHIREKKNFDIKEYASTPYVFIEPEIDEELEKKFEELRERVSIAKQTDIKEEIVKAHKAYEKFMEDAPLPNYLCIRKLIALLTEFYKDRSVSYSVQLLVSGGHKAASIKNLGEGNRYFTDQATKKKMLKDYQNEFIAFGKFLNTRYLSEEPNIL